MSCTSTCAVKYSVQFAGSTDLRENLMGSSDAYRLCGYSENSFSRRDINPTGLNADHLLLRDVQLLGVLTRRSLL